MDGIDTAEGSGSVTPADGRGGEAASDLLGTTSGSPSSVAVGHAPMRHADWMSAAALEYERLLVLFGDLSATDWRRPTVCTAWDVRQVLAHLVGAAAATASLRELARQYRLGRHHRPVVDGMNDVQVRERADVSPDRLIAELISASARGLRARRRLAAPVRALRVPFGPPLGIRSVGYLMDRIYTRDAWMHRIDVSQATDRALVLTAEHDGRLIADLVEEWGAAHGQPFDLTLTGRAGGHWSRGCGPTPVSLDAVEFARILAGRSPGHGAVLCCRVPF
ncbi:MAG: maleylpyruvate isomerase family mycothiol-dependent enzyme [Antricoccus sp.]